MYIYITLVIMSLAPMTIRAAEQERMYTSHKTSSMSNIPWNMLLDPNYTSHKLTPMKNLTFYSPSQFATNPILQHPNHRYKAPQYSTQSSVIFGTPVPNFNAYNPNKNLVFSQTEQPVHKFEDAFFKPQHVVASRPPPFPPSQSESVMFPTYSVPHTKKPDVQIQTSRPLNKDKKVNPMDTRKQTNRKPMDYLDSDDDDYWENFYDYDYSPEMERPTYRPKRRPTYIKHKGDPFGLLPSASDPEGFFAKAKDLLRGGSQGKPNYSPSASPDYYIPNKHYGDNDQGYYNDDGYGSQIYPVKNEYYPSPSFDYEAFADKRKGSRYGPLAFALGLLPLGLLLASLVPTVVTIPVSTAVATGKRRKRRASTTSSQTRWSHPVLNIISSYGSSALEDPKCLKRIFCEVTRQGREENSSGIQKIYYKLAYVINDRIAELIGIKNLLAAVRKNECEKFICEKKSTSSFRKFNTTSS